MSNERIYLREVSGGGFRPLSASSNSPFFFPLVRFWRDILSASFPNQGVQAPYSSFFVLQIKGPS